MGGWGEVAGAGREEETDRGVKGTPLQCWQLVSLPTGPKSRGVERGERDGGGPLVGRASLGPVYMGWIAAAYGEVCTGGRRGALLFHSDGGGVSCFRG